LLSDKKPKTFFKLLNLYSLIMNIYCDADSLANLASLPEVVVSKQLVQKELVGKDSIEYG